MHCTLYMCCAGTDRSITESMPFALPVPFNFPIIKGVDQTNGSDHRSLAGENSTYAIDLVLLCGWTSRVRMKRSGDGDRALSRVFKCTFAFVRCISYEYILSLK